MGDGACCHYCRKYQCECPDTPLPEPHAPTVTIEGVPYVRRDVVLEAMAALCERSDVAESSLLKLGPHRDEILRHILNAAIKEATP